MNNYSSAKLSLRRQIIEKELQNSERCCSLFFIRNRTSSGETQSPGDGRLCDDGDAIDLTIQLINR